MTRWSNQLLIGIDQGSDDLNFFTNDGLLVARGYERVVIGKRGPYVEFNKNRIVWDNFIIPTDQQYRLTNEMVFYLEFRSIDKAFVKLYVQRRTVGYADYKIGMCYISPFDLLRDARQPVIMG